MSAETNTKKGLKPLDASQPAAPGQRAEEQECSLPSINPSASPAPPSNKPVEGKYTASKQEQKSAAQQTEPDADFDWAGTPHIVRRRGGEYQVYHWLGASPHEQGVRNMLRDVRVSWAKGGSKPSEKPHPADKQEQKKAAAFKRAEIYSVLYKYAHERSFQIKKAALKSSIRQVGLDAVIGAINAGCDK